MPKRFWLQALDMVIYIVPFVVVILYYLYPDIFGGGLSDEQKINATLVIAASVAAVLPIKNAIGFFLTQRHADENTVIITQQIGQLDKTLQGISLAKIQRFLSPEHYYSYLADRARSCTASWFDMGGFDPQLVNMPESSQRSDYYNARTMTAARIQNFKYIGVFKDAGHNERAKLIMDASKNSQAALRAFVDDLDGASKIEVTIVDDEEVIMGYYRPDIPNEQKYVAVADPRVAELFKAYFLDLWNNSSNVDLKVGKTLYVDRLNQLL